MNKGKLLGKGMTAEVYEWGQDKVVKLGAFVVILYSPLIRRLRILLGCQRDFVYIIEYMQTAEDV
jgi:hypothetical protein